MAAKVNTENILSTPYKSVENTNTLDRTRPNSTELDQNSTTPQY
jgi:hypothetical protein